MTGRPDPRASAIRKSAGPDTASQAAQPSAAGRSKSLLVIMGEQTFLQSQDLSRPENLKALREFEKAHAPELAKIQDREPGYFGRPLGAGPAPRATSAAPATSAVRVSSPAIRDPIHAPPPSAPSTPKWNKEIEKKGHGADECRNGYVDPARTKPIFEADIQAAREDNAINEFEQLFGELQRELGNMPKEYWDRVHARRNEETIKEYDDRYRTRFIKRDDFTLPPKKGTDRSRLLTVALINLVPEAEQLVDEVMYLLQQTGSYQRAYPLSGRISEWLRHFRQLDASWRTKPHKVHKEPPRTSGALLPNWEYKVEYAARRRVIWYLPICVLLSVGVREADMSPFLRQDGSGVRPIKIRRAERPDELEFSIYGAKQRDGSGNVGVGERSVVVKTDAPWTQALQRALGEGKELVIAPGRHGQLWGVVHELSLDCFPDLRPCLTPKFFRNRFAAALMLGPLSTRDRMIAMGHASFESYSMYGLNKEIPVATVGAVVRVSCDRPPNDPDDQDGGEGAS